MHIVDVYDVAGDGKTKRTYGRVYYVDQRNEGRNQLYSAHEDLFALTEAMQLGQSDEK